jgi:catechol 2,3-dioxygenase-like lactoylglutathione lyase family enzyme
MDMRLEVVIVPVSDVDRAKAFYEGLGWRMDIDYTNGDDFRVVQLTPPGSQASIIIGTGITSAAPGSVEGLQLVVDDVTAARAELADRGADVSEVFHDIGGIFPPRRHSGARPRAGPGPRHLRLVRLLRRSRRQQLDRAGDHRASPGPLGST